MTEQKKEEEKSFMEAPKTESKMKYNWLGDTGLKVSELCLGKRFLRFRRVDGFCKYF